MDPPDNCPDEMYDLMCVCWEIEPGSRPSFTSLRHQLTKSFQETSETPTPSPMVARKTIPMPNGKSTQGRKSRGGEGGARGGMKGETTLQGGGYNSGQTREIVARDSTYCHANL